MRETLYGKMNWPEIEALIYSEHDNPHQILGAKQIAEGVMVSVFDPEAWEVWSRYGK